MSKEHPKVFISYSWEEDAHQQWVREFADRLLADGIDTTIDQYDASFGDRLPHFMEQSITTADYVLIICTPLYKEKADNRKGGVGYEGHIITEELYSKGNERKFIPVVRKGSFDAAMPTFLAGKLGIDLTDTIHFENNYKDLITTIYGVKKKPEIGRVPSYISQSAPRPSPSSSDEPIHILGIITDEVTVPRMDGTRGCALYKIPFRLSNSPSSLWVNIFLSTWNSPPRFSTMHRPGIASVYGDKIILDGTTIEEVRDYHRETLMLCVNIANEKEQSIIAEKKRRRELEENRKNQHYTNVASIADDIKF